MKKDQCVQSHEIWQGQSAKICIEMGKSGCARDVTKTSNDTGSVQSVSSVTTFGGDAGLQSTGHG